jgi:hypothetical protein
MKDGSDNLVRLQAYPGGVAAGIRSELNTGRYEIAPVGPNAELEFIGSDPWNTNSYTGLVVPATPSASISGARYLFLLARASFGTGEQSPENRGVRLVGIRQYAELVARLPARVSPLAESGPATGSTVTFRKEITSPLWHPFDGNISWHVMIIPKTQRDTRNPSNADGFMYEDALSPALLYQSGAASGVGYVPPNGGRPWGRPIGASLGNIHDLRYRWRDEKAEWALDIPIPVPCDVALFASVRQNDPARNPSLVDTDITQQFSALCPEDQFVVAYPTFAQYGTIAGSLVFAGDLGAGIP